MSKEKTETANKEKILITDDSQFNREMLATILGDEYDYLYAENGVEAIETLSSGVQVDVLILDINMPKLDGFQVLEIMKERRWIEEVPVVVISSDGDAVFVQKAYELGATDYIPRPFNSVVVRHKVENTLALYSRQKRLVHLVEEQVFQREKVNNMMINIFSHVVESRNRESGSHTVNVQSISSMLLHNLVKITDKYKLSEADISLISTVSALHDIGKLSVPESILNKPGKLTPEEWEIMKSHTVEGDEFLKNVEISQTDPFMIVAHQIVRYHHERWDGRGYPDGLSGDQIPISAQVVSLADVYDALTSDRCYKKAFPHEVAVNMILTGECGAFNPLLTECLKNVAEDLKIKLASKYDYEYDYRKEVSNVTDEMLADNSIPLDDRIVRMVENERTKKEFFAKQCGGMQFEYDVMLHKATFINRDAKQGEQRKVLYVLEGDDVKVLSATDWNELKRRVNVTTRENPYAEMHATVEENGKSTDYKISARTIWPVRGDKYISVVGQFTKE